MLTYVNIMTAMSINFTKLYYSPCSYGGLDS